MAKKRSLVEIREELFGLLAKVTTGITEPRTAKKRVTAINRELKAARPGGARKTRARKSR